MLAVLRVASPRVSVRPALNGRAGLAWRLAVPQVASPRDVGYPGERAVGLSGLVFRGDCANRSMLSEVGTTVVAEEGPT